LTENIGKNTNNTITKEEKRRDTGSILPLKTGNERRQTSVAGTSAEISWYKVRETGAKKETINSDKKGCKVETRSNHKRWCT